MIDNNFRAKIKNLLDLPEMPTIIEIENWLRKVDIYLLYRFNNEEAILRASEDNFRGFKKSKSASMSDIITALLAEAREKVKKIE